MNFLRESMVLSVLILITVWLDFMLVAIVIGVLKLAG